MHRGATVNIMSRWNAAAAYEVMDTLGVTLLAANPPILRDVLDVSRQKGRPRRACGPVFPAAVQFLRI
jgi:long-chain acyl-CoA synthetase